MSTYNEAEDLEELTPSEEEAERKALQVKYAPRVDKTRDHPDAITLSKVRSDEEAYETFKKILKGTYHPPLTQKVTWTWRKNLGEPELSRPAALTKAKALFWNNQTGAPAFFEIGQNFVLKSRGVQPTSEGWQAEFIFSASDFRSEHGKKLDFPAETLEQEGFTKGDPSSKVEYFTFSTKIPKDQAENFTAAAKLAIQKLQTRVPGLFTRISGAELVQGQAEESHWSLTFRFKGDLKGDFLDLNDPEIDVD